MISFFWTKWNSPTNYFLWSSALSGSVCCLYSVLIPPPRYCGWSYCEDFICTYDVNHIWLTLQHLFKWTNASSLPVMCQSLVSQHKRLRKKSVKRFSRSVWRVRRGEAAQWLWLSPTNDSDCFCIDSVSTAPNHIIKILSTFQTWAHLGVMNKANRRDETHFTSNSSVGR